jgi:CubicO group peptidase (beta-lactamase class C family)
MMMTVQCFRRLRRESAACILLSLLAVLASGPTLLAEPGRKPDGRARRYAARLQGSHDFGDLGPDWQKELSMYGSENLLFRWTTNAPNAAKGRWEITDVNDLLLAQAEVGGPPSPGSYTHFSLHVKSLGISPPFNVRIQALTNGGAPVGFLSEPVVVTLAVNNGFGTCFTEGGLGVPITDKLELIRALHGVPAVGGAVVTKSVLEVYDAVGIRKVEANPDAVTKHDRWHLGSDTKAMTSMLVGILHQKYPFTVGFGTTIAEAFPEWAGTMDPEIAPITLRQLLAHRSGLYLIPPEQAAKLTEPNLSTMDRRRAYTHDVVHDPYLIAPGVLFKYENGNYIIAGAMLENLFAQSWESLMTQHLFGPLNMTTAGFGSPAAGNQPQPWGHYESSGAYVPTLGDNPAALGPAGTVHASLADWAKFIRLYLDGSEGGVTLSAATLQELTTAYTSNDPWFVVWPQTYGWGWGIFPNPGDKVLSHDGSNTLWYARAVVYMDRGYALLGVANAAVFGDGNKGMDAVGDVVALLESHHRDCPDNRGKLRFSPPPGISSIFDGSVLRVPPPRP